MINLDELAIKNNYPVTKSTYQNKITHKLKQSYTLSLNILNAKGMHTRPSTSVHDIAEAFDLINIKVGLGNQQPVNAKNVMELMALGAGEGSILNVKVYAKTSTLKAKKQALQGAAALKLLICDFKFFDTRNGRNTYDQSKMSNFIHSVKTSSIDSLNDQLEHSWTHEGQRPPVKNRIRCYLKKRLDKNKRSS